VLPGTNADDLLELQRTGYAAHGLSAHGRVLPVDLKFGNAQLEGVRDLVRRFGVGPVALRPMKSLRVSIGRVLRNLPSNILKASNALSKISGALGVMMFGLEAADAAEEAMRISDAIKQHIDDRYTTFDAAYDTLVEGEYATQRGGAHFLHPNSPAD
jgi:hypothetical protein